jgi:DNA-binding protein YbaB
MSAAIVFVSWAIVCREEERRATAPVVEKPFLLELLDSFLSRHDSSTWWFPNSDSIAMKLASVATVLFAVVSSDSASAFTTSSSRKTVAGSCSSTSQYLFGSKPKAEGSKQQPGMMDQLAMFKKAQELSQKKTEIDKELANEKIVGTAADGNIKVTIKYIPPQLPVNPTPGYEAAEVDIDEAYLESVSAEELSASLVEAIRNGEVKAAELVGQKYKVLEEAMKSIMGGGAPPS